MKKIANALTMLLIVLMIMPIAVQVKGDPGTTLSATVSATAHWTRTFHWGIGKSVTPDTWNLFSGDAGTSKYTITVTKDSGTDEYYVEGDVSVTNGGAVATQNLAITIEVRDGFPPPKDLIATASVDVSSNPVLDPGETGSYPYQVGISVIGTGVYKVTAVVTITNHSGHEGTPYGPSPSADAYLPSSPTLINNVIHVDDSNGGSWTFSASGFVSYEKTFTCANEGENENTATIRETGQSDSATVTVNCYELEVTKDAKTSFTRTYTWTIDKTADTDSLELEIGETASVSYSITVDATYTDSDWTVTEDKGIKVHNPAPIPATINSISDIVSPAIAASVDFEVSFPYTLPAGETLTGKYTASLPDASSRTNTATVTLQNYDYDWDGSKTATGTTDFSGTAGVGFSSAIIKEVDKSITVSDTYAGDHQVTYADLPWKWIYSRTIGPYSSAGEYTVENTASFVTADTGATGSDSWTVHVTVTAPPAATISGVKFYDNNANGFRDGGENGLKGWTIQLWKLDDTWTLVKEVQTGDAGDYIFENLYPGTYKVTEVFPPAPPIYIATTYTSFTVVLTDGETVVGPEFGNVCVKQGTGGLTLGFWSNKNGQALITGSDVATLNGLALFTPAVWTYPPFSITLNTAKTQIKNYLLSATAKDMRWMLSAQLIATELDVIHGYLSASTIVYVGPSTFVPTGFITIGDIMNNANGALSMGTSARATQEYWKNLLDGLNNNRLPFVCPSP
jgi:hypothetical protein